MSASGEPRDCLIPKERNCELLLELFCQSPEWRFCSPCLHLCLADDAVINVWGKTSLEASDGKGCQLEVCWEESKEERRIVHSVQRDMCSLLLRE